MYWGPGVTFFRMALAGMKEKLRIGILIDSDRIPAWAFKILMTLQESDYATICLTIKNQPSSTILKRPPFLQRIWNNRHSIFYILYDRFDRKKFVPQYDAFEERDIAGFIQAPSITVQPIRTRFRDSFSQKDVETIRSHRLDIMIRMGFRILQGDILQAARFGVWSYHHGDNFLNRGGPPGFWEVMEQWDETGAILQILNEDLDNGFVLHRAYYSTKKKSVTSNRNNYFWKAASILPQKIAELYRDGQDVFNSNHAALNAHPGFYSRRLYREPSNLQMLKGIGRLVQNKVRWELNRLFFFEQWIMLFALGKESNPSTTFYRFKRLLPPKDRFWADPHIVQREGKYYIFFEELLYRTNKGHISVIEMDDKGNHTPPKVVLDKPYHLSYPFIFEEDGETYMIPETQANNTIEMYRCRSFPDQWEFHSVLLDSIDAVDATIWKKDGIYFLFTSVKGAPESGDYDSLHIYYSNSLEKTQWIPHPANPIKNDVKTGRMAGKLFMHNGNLYRPAQDGSRQYGYAMHFQQITKLNTMEFEEHSIASIFPEWEKDLLCTHTFNSVGRLTVIDALIKRKK